MTPKQKPHPQPARTDNSYLEHVHRLSAIGKMIDNNPPRLHIDNWLKSEHAKVDLIRLNEITRDNKTLLSRINTIMRSTGCTDNYNPLAGIRHSKLRKMIEGLEEIERDNKYMFKRIGRTKADITNSYLNTCWQANLIAIRDKAKYAIILPGIRPPVTEEDSCDLLDQYRPRAFFEFAHPTGRVLGKITVLLYSDIAPITAGNFMELILNHKRQRTDADGEQHKSFPHYIGSPVYRIFKGLFIEIGDNTKFNGCGGASSFGTDFPQENFAVPADYAGMLAMIPDNDGMVNSKFLITVKPLKVLTGKRVIFGRVIKGMKCIHLMENSALPNLKPEEPIFITKCGLIPSKKMPKK